MLRPECLLREPADFKVYRPAEGDAQGPKAWRPLRKGIADLHRRGAVCQAANERYLEALAAVHDRTPLRQLVQPLCCRVPDPAQRRPRPAAASAPTDAGLGTGSSATAVATAADPRRHGVRPRRVRALNPLAPEDAALLEAVSRHEFLINGLRNRDLRRLLFGEPTASASQERKRSAAVTRKLRLLRAHGLLHKIPKTHRYLVSEQGRNTITALLAARNASTEQLIGCAG